MAQKIYLSRHAPTIQNIVYPDWGNYDEREFPRLFDLAPNMRYKAKILGKYLNGKVKDPVFVASELGRTGSTVGIASKEMEIVLDAGNFYRIAELNECQTAEQEALENGYDVTGLEYKSFLASGFVTEKELGERARCGLLHVAKEKRNTPIVVVGHLGTNSALLKNIGASSKYSAVGNCSLFELERRGNRIVPLKYLSNKELQARL